MMARQSIDRQLRVATAGLEPQAISALLAREARRLLAEAQAAGEAPRRYQRFVNGREGVAEDRVIPPGPIVYNFSWLPEVVVYALGYAEGRSPVLSGRYKKSWFAMVGTEIVTDYEAIDMDAEVIITNNQPYSRKIDVGHMKMSVPPGIAEDVRQTVMRRFGNVVVAERRLVHLPNPYILKGRFSRGVRTFARTKLKPDVGAGREMTYPAVVIRALI